MSELNSALMAKGTRWKTRPWKPKRARRKRKPPRSAEVVGLEEGVAADVRDGLHLEQHDRLEGERTGVHAEVIGERGGALAVLLDAFTDAAAEGAPARGRGGVARSAPPPAEAWPASGLRRWSQEGC